MNDYKKNEGVKMKTVLVVDDDEDIRESVGIILRINRYRVITAVDADDCLNKLQSESPDLILLDIMMPGRPITDIVKQVTDIKIVFMSIVRESDAKNKGLCEHNNVVDFLQKPFNLNDLVSKIELLLKEEV